MVLILVALLVSGSILWYLSDAFDTIGPQFQGEISIEGDDIVALNVRMVEKKYNKPSLELTAERSVISADDTYTKMKNFTLVSHSEKAGEIILSAEDGAMINATKNISASGNVLVRDNLGRALSTDTLKWINSERRIVTDDDVRVYGRTFAITGKGMVAYPDEERVEILKDVHAVFLETGELGKKLN